MKSNLEHIETNMQTKTHKIIQILLTVGLSLKIYNVKIGNNKVEKQTKHVIIINVNNTSKFTSEV